MLPAGFVLMSPWTDLTVSGKTHETKADVDPVLNQNYLNEMIENYVPQAKKVQGQETADLQAAGAEEGKPGAKPVSSNFEELFDTEYLQNPEISPLFGDFTGFPPTYIQVGELEVLMSDSTMLQKKMSKDGVSVSLDTYKNMWHVFQMGPFKTAVEAIQKCGEFIYSVQ